MFRSFNRCFPWLFVLVLRVSSTRTRTRRYGIEYEYEYHFIEYEYDKSQNSATSKANGEEVAISHSCRPQHRDNPHYLGCEFDQRQVDHNRKGILSRLSSFEHEHEHEHEHDEIRCLARIYLVKANGGNSLVDEVISVFKPEAPFLAYLPLRRSGPTSPSPCIF